jgi:hypothetical protein
MIITIFDSTGHIDRWVSCPESMAAVQCAPGEQAIAGQYLSESHYVDCATLQAMAKPPRPSDTHVFDYATKQWLPDPAAAWQAARVTRNQALAASDWTQLPDVPASTKSAWAAYRQALRNITQQPDPHNIVWPVKPN